jgi:hypothetical protein
MNSKTVPASGRNTICIDFDGTIIPFVSDLYADVAPIRGAISVLRGLKERGYQIVIFTSRMSETWWRYEAQGAWRDFGNIQHKYVYDILTKHEIPFDRITSEKVPAILYLDDRAVPFRNSWDMASDMMEDALDDEALLL